jgi:hypothetical protein
VRVKDVSLFDDVFECNQLNTNKNLQREKGEREKERE